ncbi:nuclease-related domain-containing protein [Salinisphaera dokdonensis]|uniref:nuclease-related domain-containing protein n=1 Tax=Salinisphaera dokdonensis TaxID=454598 RepID=UPI003340B043
MAALTYLSFPRDYIRQRWRLLLWSVTALPMLFALFGTQEPLALLVFGGLTLNWMSVPASRRVAYRGQVAVARRIARLLPDGYSLFTQLEIPNPYSHPDVTVLDAVIVGPTGVCVVGVKSNRGVVIADSAHKRYWPVRKVGRGGTVYYSQTRNPVRQATGQARALREHLKRRGIRVWVNPLVISGSRHTQWQNNQIQPAPILAFDTRCIEHALFSSNVRLLEDFKVTQIRNALLPRETHR